MKRFVAAGLWLYAFWFLGSMLAAALRVPDLLGPTLGIAAGVLVAVDHRQLFWSRSASINPAAAPA